MNCRLDYPVLEIVCCFCAMNDHEGSEHGSRQISRESCIRVLRSTVQHCAHQVLLSSKMLIRLNYKMQRSHARSIPAKAN